MYIFFQGFPGDISDVECHPTRALVAFTCSDPGSLQIWNYDMKLLMNLREFNTVKEKDLNNKSLSLKTSKLTKAHSLAKGLASDTK